MLNIGFIGGGGIARHHAARLTQIKGARILAVSDVVAAAANSFASDLAPSTTRPTIAECSTCPT